MKAILKTFNFQWKKTLYTFFYKELQPILFYCCCCSLWKSIHWSKNFFIVMNDVVKLDRKEPLYYGSCFSMFTQKPLYLVIYLIKRSLLLNIPFAFNDIMAKRFCLIADEAGNIKLLLKYMFNISYKNGYDIVIHNYHLCLIIQISC